MTRAAIALVLGTSGPGLKFESRLVEFSMPTEVLKLVAVC